MTEQDKKLLKQDLDAIIENMTNVDRTGQFLASAARYLHAIDSERYAPAVEKLVAATIDKDREHAYLPALIRGIYGDNFAEGAEERCATDRNFRRMYQRLFPRPDSL